VGRSVRRTFIRILVANDDGMHVPGLWTLVEELSRDNQVTVVAPDREQSGVGTAISLHRILRVREVKPETPGVTAYAVEGTPGDCVILGLGELAKDTELVVAGINEGANLGEDVLISGTVGACLQALFRGVPAIAVSVSALGSVNYRPAARIAARLARAMGVGLLPRRMVLNVNVPDLPAEEIRGVMVTRQAARRYADILRRETDTRGKSYFWIVRGRPEWDVEEGTDIWAILNGFVSLLPLHSDLLCATCLPQVEATCQAVWEGLQEI
jgi:5'-nucleotidase